jgi:hypothetical protein
LGFVPVERVEDDRFPVLLVLALMGLFASPVAGMTPEEFPQESARVTSARWTASAFSHHAAGSLCWIRAQDGSLRVEVLLENGEAPDEPQVPGIPAGPDLAPLFSRTGEGWTLVLGPGEEGTLNPWDREWRQVPAGLAQLARLVTTYVDVFPERPSGYSSSCSQPTGRIYQPRVLRSGDDLSPAGVDRFELAPLGLDENPDDFRNSFRRNLTDRGRGRGGPGEMIVLRWDQAGNQDSPGLTIRSSRRPGELHLEGPVQKAISSPDPEVFLPLWPLSQFFEIP